MRRRGAAWTVFGACACCGVALLLWLTQAVLRLEEGEARARARADHEAAIGTALWQMDAWLLPLLAEEAQRPPAHYAPFQSVADAYDNVSLSKLSPGEVVTPSPLLAHRSALFPLHFQVEADGRVTSPQVPEGNQLDVVQTQNALPNLATKRTLLERMRALLTPSRLIAGCSAGAAALPEVQLRQQVGAPPEQLQARNYNERAQVTAPARNPAKWVAPGPMADPAAASTLVPIWLDDPAHGDCLVFARRVLVGGRPAYQGMLADWGKLSASLLAAITDPAIAAGARLVRLPQPAATQLSHQLTVLPAALAAPPPPWVDPGWTPGRTLLAAAWIALLAGGIAVALTLAATLRFADRRARFASAVTHELRTPLTTFRMYSEMLAKGMVPDEARRQHYLATLQTESDRLARLVENVLGYARIEDGRFTARVEAIDLGSLVARVRPVLERRAAEAGMDLAIAVRAPDARLEVDCDAVGQILFNLVDNACKYGKPPLTLTAELASRHAVLALRDHGPGIPARYRARIFAAFDRGARPMGDNEVPGVGLGLALARELARDLGGDLVLADGGPGARFAVTLPLAG